MKVSLNDYLKRGRQRFMFYNGSLTTPNCDEIVNWIVLSEIQSCSAKQLSNMVDKIGGNYRNSKPVNGRVIYVSEIKEEPKEKWSVIPFIVIICTAITVIAALIVFFYVRRKKQRLLDQTEIEATT